MGYELLLCEKPISCKKIAEALADNKPKKLMHGKIPYYEITIDNKKVVLGSAVGHLFALKEKNGKGWKYPVFDYEWQPKYLIDKDAVNTKDFIDTLSFIAKGANKFTVCTDFDEEGSTLGKEIVEYVFKKKDARRMKFSSLTKEELQESYKNAISHLDWEQVHAGEARHEMDFLYGINSSRALTLAVKSAGTFQILSAGRVQGPALKLFVDLEKKIKKFKPEPYWEISLKGLLNKTEIEAFHVKGKFKDKKEADKVVNVTKNKKALVETVTKKSISINPPFPFDLTSLQLEAYKYCNISPKQTMGVTQNLYVRGYITYPRTSSQKLPLGLNIKKLFTNLSRQEKYSKIIEKLLLKQTLRANEGPKSDNAHPACIPTGDIPKNLKGKELQVYDLIVRRFLSSFGDKAEKENMNLKIDCNKEKFSFSCSKVLEKGWMEIYHFVKSDSIEIPGVKEGDEVKNPKILLYAKETQPPKRFTAASIIKELEERNLGTKSTRALILDTLYQRHYIQEKSVQVTDLGEAVCDTLEEYVPELVSENLTRHFEEELEQIRENKKKKEEVVDEVKDVLKKVLKVFKSSEEKIGKKLLKAVKETRAEQENLGLCPECKKGDLTIRRGKFGRFATCNTYPKCKITFSLPSNAMILPAKKLCETCNYPIIKVIKKATRPRETCLNKECKSKEVPKEILKKYEGRKCPKCQTELIVRKSVYGSFLACPKYPSCRHIEQIKLE